MLRARYERAFGRVLQGAGVAILIASIAAVGSASASADLGATFLSVFRVAVGPFPIPPQWLPTPAPSPSPSTEPTAAPALPEGPPPSSPAPKAAFRTRSGGPLEFTLTGSLGLGSRTSALTFTNPLGNELVPTSSASSQNDASVGMNAELRRRTAQTTFDARIPIGVSSRGAQFGSATALYSTAHYSLGYGSFSMSLFGQVAPGQTQRGYQLIIPVRSGDISFFRGPGYGVNSEPITLQGFRERKLLGNSLIELGLAQTAGGEQTGSALTELLGTATGFRNGSSVIAEAALQQRRAPDARFNPSAFSIRYDSPGTRSGYTLTLRDVQPRFLSTGAGELQGDRYADVGFHVSPKHANISGDVGFEVNTFGSSIASVRRSTLSDSSSFGKVAYTLTVSDQRLVGTQPASWNGLAGIQFGVPVRSGFLLLGVAGQRQTAQDVGPASTLTYNGQISQQLRNIAVQYSLQDQRQITDAIGPAHQLTQTVAFTKTFGKTGLGFTYETSLNQSAITDTLQRLPSLTIQRSLSPALAVQMQYGLSSLNDKLHPSSNSRGRQFSIEINAPFSLGNGAVSGRADPRLPASIVGRVINDVSSNGALAGFVQSGLSNVQIVLDDKEVQRTDLDGNFQFSFLKAGPHSIRVEPSSIPRGYTVDFPLQTIKVLGGQTGQAVFRVGQFGGITGHVFGTGSDGSKLPLSNVQLRVDGAQYSQTDSTGLFGFGRLAPGEHTVEVIPNTIPAFANFAKEDLTKKISVQKGILATMEFIAQPLGSITGRLVYDESLAPDYRGAVTNAYVVAEPGEHAAITDDDGVYIIDNLPPGTYTVSVDPETLDDGLGQQGEPLSIALTPQEKYQGAVFTIAKKIKKVVFTVMSGGGEPAQLHVREPKLPPGGLTEIYVTAAAGTTEVGIDAFDKSFDLKEDKAHGRWVGAIEVPASAKAGKVEITARTHGAVSVAASAFITVDPSAPLAIMQVIPPNPLPSQYATVRARFLVDAHEGDKIEWQDGTETVLPKPLVGRVFTFNMRISLRPLHGVLLTHAAKLPIVIM